MTAGLARIAATAVGVLALLVGVVTSREIETGRRAIAEADAAFASGDLSTAVTRARDAAEAAAPGSPYPRQGFTRLESLARAAEARGDERTAVAAWGAMRTAATATSGAFGGDGWAALANEGLVRAGARPLVASAEVHAPEATLRASLGHEDAPSVALLALLGFGGATFVAGCAWLAIAARDQKALRKERWAVVVTVLGAASYAIACFRA